MLEPWFQQTSNIATQEIIQMAEMLIQCQRTLGSIDQARSCDKGPKQGLRVPLNP